jgi:hypothetical protein
MPSIVKWMKSQTKNSKNYRMIYQNKEIINKCLNEVHENTNKQLNEMRMTIQDLKMEFSKDTEILTKKKFWKKPKSQLKALSIEWVKLNTVYQGLNTM